MDWTSQMPTDNACEKIVVKKVYRVVPVTPTDDNTAVVVASSVGIALHLIFDNHLVSGHSLKRQKV